MIYDCFTFFNELDVLEIRLNELNGVVDRFVLVEATHTHSGRPKPLYYADNKDRFKLFKDKIIHVVVTDLPESTDTWVRENYQRQCILRGLVNCDDNDSILVSDVDEVPTRDSVARGTVPGGIFVFEQVLCYYHLNTFFSWWHGTRACRYAQLRALGGPQRLRLTAGTVIESAGWHFSFLGDVNGIVNKLHAFAHQEFNTSHYVDPVYISAAMETCTDLFQRGVRGRVVGDAELPTFVKSNRARYEKYFLKDGCTAVTFTEKWYNASQLRHLRRLCDRVRFLEGDVVEVGCWEGRSTATIANAAFPSKVLAVDTWRGNGAESVDHITVKILQQRDVYATFIRNMMLATDGNVAACRSSSVDFFKESNTRIKLCHIDACHDYASVKEDICGALGSLVEGGCCVGTTLRMLRRIGGI